MPSGNISGILGVCSNKVKLVVTFHISHLDAWRSNEEWARNGKLDAPRWLTAEAARSNRGIRVYSHRSRHHCVIHVRGLPTQVDAHGSRLWLVSLLRSKLTPHVIWLCAQFSNYNRMQRAHCGVNIACWARTHRKVTLETDIGLPNDDLPYSDKSLQ